MKIGKAILGVVAGVALSGSTLAQTVAKDSSVITKNDSIAKAMEHVQLPKADSADTFITRFKSGDVLDVPKSSIKVVDPDNGENLTQSINKIDSTIIRDGGINMNKVDSLEDVYYKKTKFNLPNEEYENILNNTTPQKYNKLTTIDKSAALFEEKMCNILKGKQAETSKAAQYADFLDKGVIDSTGKSTVSQDSLKKLKPEHNRIVKKDGTIKTPSKEQLQSAQQYRFLQKNHVMDSAGTINPLDSAQKAYVKAKIADNNTRQLLTQVAYPHIIPMVKTGTLEKAGKDSYQEVAMNEFGDIKTFTVKGKSSLDSANYKVPEVHAQYENPTCGKIGYATTQYEVIHHDFCNPGAGPVYTKRQSQDSVVADTLKKTVSLPKAAVDSSAQKADTATIYTPIHKRELTDISLNKKDSAVAVAQHLKNDKAKYKTHTTKKGESVWGIAQKTLGKDAKQKDVLKLTKTILKLNNMTMESAKHLKTNVTLRLPVVAGVTAD